MDSIKELVSQDCNYFTGSRMSLDSDKTREFKFALEVSSAENSINKFSDEDRSYTCPTCKCPYLKYTREQMELNPVQFNDEYGSVILLTRDDVDNVRKKWRKIKNDPLTFGTLMLIHLLNDAPETAKKIPANPGVLCNGVLVYDDITLGNAKRRAEAMNVIIQNLETPEYATFLAHQIGVKNTVDKSIELTKKDYQAVHNATMKTVTTNYKMDNTPEIIHSFRKFLWIIIGIIEDSTHWNNFEVLLGAKMMNKD